MATTQTYTNDELEPITVGTDIPPITTPVSTSIQGLTHRHSVPTPCIRQIGEISSRWSFPRSKTDSVPSGRSRPQLRNSTIRTYLFFFHCSFWKTWVHWSALDSTRTSIGIVDYVCRTAPRCTATRLPSRLARALPSLAPRAPSHTEVRALRANEAVRERWTRGLAPVARPWGGCGETIAVLCGSSKV